MAREATITQEQVNAAADAIRASGAKPTARAIRDQLGTGSMATVLKFLQVWQSGQVKPAAQDVTLPPALTRALVDFIGQEVAQARAGLEAELATAQQSQADLIGESERQGAMIEGLAEELEQERAEKAELQGKLGQMESDLATARDEAARERQAAEAARTELAKAQLRLEAMPLLEKQNERLQGALDAERNARTDAERQAVAAEAKAAGLADRLADAQERQRQTADELARATTYGQGLTDRVNELQGMVYEANSLAKRHEADASRTREELAKAIKAGEEAAELRGQLAALKGGSTAAPAKPKGTARPGPAKGKEQAGKG